MRNMRKFKISLVVTISSWPLGDARIDCVLTYLYI